VSGLGARPARPASCLGLTLVELMLVLALLATVASLAVPQWGRQMGRWQMQAVAERLAGDLADARFAAVQRRSAQHVHIQGGERWCWSVSEQPDCPCDVEQSCQRQRVVAPLEGRVALADSLSLRFEPSAQIQGQAAQRISVVSAHGERLQVSLTPLGRARVCVPEDAGGLSSSRIKPC
jgi:type IV fimbrial biogenesis protein FimT